MTKDSQTTRSAISAPEFPLRDCPASPNCVCTLASRQSQRVPTIAVQGSTTQTMQALVDCISSLPRTEIVERTPHYLHVAFRSRIMQFVDDVEFYLHEEQQQLHFRSASRLGYYDFGANRRRMERIRQMLKLAGTGGK